jgi:phosphoribosylformylglycinamidine synthase
MKTVWDNGKKSVVAPLSLIISAAARVSDVRGSFTPELRTDQGETELWLIDLGRGQDRLGGSVLLQAYGELGDAAPNVDEPKLLISFFDGLQELRRRELILSYHDRSDGGLFATVCEMMFAGGTGVTLALDGLVEDPMAPLFSEELGAVVQIRSKDVAEFRERYAAAGLPADCLRPIGQLRSDDLLVIERAGVELTRRTRSELRRIWSETSFAMQSLRDEPRSAAEEYELVQSPTDPGMVPLVTFDPEENVAKPYLDSVVVSDRPRMAILREQGVNGEIEMAAAFDRAGFDAVDVHMSDLHTGRVTLDGFRGLVACGGFSYGDVLGAGQGWAKSILYQALTREQLTKFFKREDTFALGICNGCQMLAALKDLIPGAEDFPSLVRNRCEQFEARYSLVEVVESKSVLLAGMAGSLLPIAVAHGEGRMQFASPEAMQRMVASRQIGMRFVDHAGKPTEHYPENPNGSPSGLTGICNADGRVTLMMPHPERVFRNVQLSYCPPDWTGEHAPWSRLFQNARRWVG